jgi:hypothetical protein
VTAFAILSLVGFFYSALVPGLLSKDLQQKSPAVSGLVVFGLFIVAAITAASTQKLKSHTAMMAGLALLPAGLALLIAAQVEHSMLLPVIGTIVGGISTGLGYCGGKPDRARHFARCDDGFQHGRAGKCTFRRHRIPPLGPRI